MKEFDNLVIDNEVLRLRELYRYEKWLKDYCSYDHSNNARYKYKSELISKHCNEYIASLENYSYRMVKNGLDIDYFLTNWFNDNFGFCAELESRRLRHAYIKRLSNLKKRIDSILYDSHCSYFLTFTFNEFYLDNIDDKYKRVYVTRWLKKFTFNYVGNVDYGERNGRIHFHAVVSADFIDGNSWQYGALNFEIIRVCRSDIIGKYVSKLINHALKESTKRQALIYPKNKTTSHN